jgi:hypothetical protein
METNDRDNPLDRHESGEHVKDFQGIGHICTCYVFMWTDGAWCLAVVACEGEEDRRGDLGESRQCRLRSVLCTNGGGVWWLNPIPFRTVNNHSDQRYFRPALLTYLFLVRCVLG